MAETKDIKYINREFNDLRAQLIEFSKNYFPDTYNDFSPTSPGMMFIEMASYVGDVLSFYQDTQLQETFLQHAKNPSNLYSLAYMLGYRPKVSSAAEVELTVTQRVAATGPTYKPNFDQAIKISENAIISATVGDNLTFITQDAVDFTFSSSYDPTDVRVFSLDNGNPAEYLLTKRVKASSGTIQTTSQTYTTAEKYATFTINEPDIIGILDITDSDGNTWTEVPFLGQDTVFEEEVNTSADSGVAPNRLTLKKVSRRFVTRFTSKGALQVQFGSGISPQSDDVIVPNPTTVQAGSSWTDVNGYFKAYDPSNFTFTQTYGLAPSNTTLTIRYIVGGGVESNVPANTLTSIDTIQTTAVDSTYVGTITFNNVNPAAGGKDGDSTEELRQNALRSFAEQQRVVTLQDYAVRSLALPPQFGSISKSYVTQEVVKTGSSLTNANPLAISLFVLGYDNNRKLTPASFTLKQNLKTYLSQFMMITDAVDIKDGFVINIGVKFEIITLPGTVGRDVLLNCTNQLIDYFDTDKWSINQPINLSSIYTLLDRIKGVQTVKSVKIVNKAGDNYSQFAYDIEGATKNNVVYPSLDPSCFEVKFPNIDIEGRVTSL
jgi:hypothetical protein